MRAYIDFENKLHLKNDGTMTEVEVELDDQSARVIESYKYYPEKGLLVLWKNADETFGAQKQYADMAKSIGKMTGYLSDEQAESVTDLYPYWAVNIAYATGDRRQYNGLLYKCIQTHTSQADWTPDIVPALWVRI